MGTVWPYSRSSIQTALEPRAVMEQLHARHLAEAGLDLVSSNGTSFKLIRRQRLWQYYPYLPQINGMLTDRGDGTEVRLVFAIKTSEFVAVLLGFLVMSAASLRAGDTIGFPLFILVFYHVVGMLFGFTPASWDAELVLRKVLWNAGPPQPGQSACR